MDKMLLIGALASLLIACSSGGGAGDEDADAAAGNDLQALEQMDRQFSFDPDQALDAIYSCSRSGSRLEYLFDLRSGGDLTLAVPLDTGDVAYRSGTHHIQNGVISLNIPPNDLLILDEQSTETLVHLGMIVAFKTPNMLCGMVGHRYDDPGATALNVSYACPIVREGPASDVENVFEFQITNGNPRFSVPGSIFRQRDRHVNGATNPFIKRGYGIYRRQGDQYYGLFYYPGANPFDDFNIVTGSFANSDQQIRVNQLPGGAQVCQLR